MATRAMSYHKKSLEVRFISTCWISLESFFIFYPSKDATREVVMVMVMVNMIRLRPFVSWPTGPSTLPQYIPMITGSSKRVLLLISVIFIL